MSATRSSVYRGFCEAVIHNRPPKGRCSAQFLSRLPFPGNIRELKNLVERTILVCGKPLLSAADFESQCTQMADMSQKATVGSFEGMTLDEIERQTIRQALEQYKGNLSQVAQALGISRAALYRRLEKHGITVS